MGYEVVGTWRQVVHWGPVMAISTTLTISYVTIKCLIMLWPPFDSLAAFLNLIMFLGCMVMILGNFFMAVFKGPGFVPFGWKPENAEHIKSMQFCDCCQGYKAPRSHHCRKCERCVMKMDHHCPWINTCCGHLNQANFCLFLFFAVCGCILALCVLLPSIYKSVYFDHYVRSGQEEGLVYLERPVMLVIMFSVGLSIGALIAISVLFYMQMKIILKNQTGIEGWIIDKAHDRERGETEGPFVYPYNLGWYQNLRQVFTLSMRPRSDGYIWDLVEGCNQYTLTEEQLKQKAEKRERSELYIVERPYSGYLFPCSKGLRVACCIPCTDEPRIRLTPGDTVRVTRWKKRWLYGTKVSADKNTCLDSQGKNRIRGWFPRVCAKELAAADQKIDDKKDV
ncbi:palmitoyltransferase ZDHHC6-like [Babylonia areolata]|uniref:palmitoyltransferase ZDHHC6-like n=1 Tax=Babylonia areolata TaxID=304850 RepID=UPI003FD49F89